MKLCSAQIKPIKGDIESNIQKHISFIHLAVENGADLIFFPELSLTGYEPTLAKELAINKNDIRLSIFQEISDAQNIIICVGIPTFQNTGICISMFIFQPKQLLQIYSKQHLHSDEFPYFTEGNSQTYISYKNHKIAPAICYESLLTEHVENTSKHDSTIYLASVAKSSKGVEKANKHYPEIAQKFGMIVLMANSIGLSDDFVSYGNSAVWNTDGKIVDKLNEINEGVLLYNIDNQDIIKIYL